MARAGIQGSDFQCFGTGTCFIVYKLSLWTILEIMRPEKILQSKAWKCTVIYIQKMCTCEELL